MDKKPTTARIFVLPGAMTIAHILRLEKSTGLRTNVSRRGNLELIP